MVGLLGGCEMLQEAGDGEVEGKLAGNLVGFPEPPVVAAGIGIEDDCFAAEDSCFFDVEAVEVSGCKPVIILVDYACDHRGFLCLNDRYRLVGVETEEVLTKVALREVKVGE